MAGTVHNIHRPRCHRSDPGGRLCGHAREQQGGIRYLSSREGNFNGYHRAGRYGLSMMALSSTQPIRSTALAPMRSPSRRSEKVYDAKKRDLSKPISIAVSDFEMLAAVSASMHPCRSSSNGFAGHRGSPGEKIIQDLTRRGPGRSGSDPGPRDRPAGHREVRCTHNGNERKPVPAGKTRRHGRVHGAPRSPHRRGSASGTPSTVVDLVTRTIVRRRGAKRQKR